ncbi:hypothetical protein V6N12_045251 [Hibiscus sabdariffa]|uniref:Uncharacterized protein n=1 Tax=Hibiscus sabdariffa TaxID=183260 RepID=A0ABR2G289_9ROSI
MVTTRNQSGNPSRPPTIFGGGRRRFAAHPVIDVPSSSDSLPQAVPDPPPPTAQQGGHAPQPRTSPSPTLTHHSSDFMVPPQSSVGPSRPRPFVHTGTRQTSRDNFASRFPNPPPQLSPEPTHSSHNRHSQPSSFAASYDEVPPEDDYDDVDCHGRRRRGHAFTVPGDEVLQGYLDFDNEDALRFHSIRHRRLQVYFNFSMGFVTDVTDQSFLTVLREILTDFGANSAYGRLTNLPNAAYNAWNIKGWHIHDPTLRYIH